MPPRSVPAGFLRQPAPRPIGNPDRGRQILGGELPLAGSILRGDPFALTGLSLICRAELHGFGWLDDLAAVGTHDARLLARRHVLGWIAAHPDPAPRRVEWLPEIAGRRLLRWLFHAGLFQPGLERAAMAQSFDAMQRHLRWLRDGWSSAPEGLPRLEALSALAMAAIHLPGHQDIVEPALLSLGESASAAGFAAFGVSRSPEALLDACALLVWSAEAADAAGLRVPAPLDGVIAELAPVLRGLRHADGALPQFHGGGRGAPGRLDHCLRAASGAAVTARGRPLGFARLARGRSTVLVDTAPPPSGEAAGQAHASTLALELTVARQPLIVSAGPGAEFGPVWAGQARRTQNHSTLCLAGLSSSHFEPAAAAALDWPELLIPGPRQVWAGDYDDEGRLVSDDCGLPHSADPAHLVAGHDGWLDSHGLTHMRELWLEPDGLILDGEDILAASDGAAQARLAQRIARPAGAAGGGGLGFDIRFHLHPAVLPRIEGATVALILPHGGSWQFSHDGRAALRLEPSFWLDPASARPTPTHQIVLSGLLQGHAVQIGWTLAQAEVR